MTIQDWGSVGELVGAVATVATLLYLAVQIRTNTLALRADARRSVGATGTAAMAAVCGSLSATRVMRLGCEDFGALGDDERMQFFLQFAILVSQAEHAFLEFQNGLIDKDALDARTFFVHQILGTRGGLAWWNLWSRTMGTPFRDHCESRMDALRADPGASKPDA